MKIESSNKNMEMVYWVWMYFGALVIIPTYMFVWNTWTMPKTTFYIIEMSFILMFIGMLGYVSFIRKERMLR